MKKMLKTILALTMVVVLSACSAVIAEKKEDYSNKTLTGQITNIDNTTVSLDLGKLKKSDKNEEKNEEQMPGDFNDQAPEFNEGQKPELPDDFNGEFPEDFNGEMPEGFIGEKPNDFNPQDGMMQGHGQKPDGQIPEGFDGQKPDLPEDFNGELPEEYDGEKPQGGPGQMMGNENGGMPGMSNTVKDDTSYTFKKKTDTATIDLKGVSITLTDGSTGTVDDLEIGDVIQIVVDENNNVSSVTVYQVFDEMNV